MLAMCGRLVNVKSEGGGVTKNIPVCLLAAFELFVFQASHLTPHGFLCF